MARLALAGGTPVRTTPFPRWPDFDARERSLLLEALEARSWGGYPFPNALAGRFASAFAAAHDARHALLTAPMPTGRRGRGRGQARSATREHSASRRASS